MCIPVVPSDSIKTSKQFGPEMGVVDDIPDVPGREGGGEREREKRGKK